MAKAKNSTNYSSSTGAGAIRDELGRVIITFPTVTAARDELLKAWTKTKQPSGNQLDESLAAEAIAAGQPVFAAVNTAYGQYCRAGVLGIVQ